MLKDKFFFSAANILADDFVLPGPYKLWSWGWNVEGRTGLGSVTNSTVSPQQIGSATTWSTIAPAARHTLALRTDNTLWGWGRDIGNGTLGQGGNVVTLSSPQQLDSGFKKIAAGLNHSLAIKNDGNLWGFGSNFDNRLGLPGGGSLLVPTLVSATGDWKEISAAANHSLGIKTNGTLWAWGANADGKTGLGTTTGSSLPTQVGSATDWEQISAGYDFSLALKSNGTLWAWGSNNKGQTGLGVSLDTITSTPQQVGSATDWEQISTYNSATVEGGENTFALALKTNGTAWGWGSNSLGQIAQPLITEYLTIPTQIGTDANWKSLAAGTVQALGVKTNGTLWAWGYNERAPLGLGFEDFDVYPVTQVGTATDWEKVAAGDFYSFGLKA